MNSATLATRDSISMVQDGTVGVRVEEGTVVLTDDEGRDANVIVTDVPACSSVIHVIDSVLIPEFSTDAPTAAPTAAPTTTWEDADALKDALGRYLRG